MDPRTYTKLELDKILQQLAAYASFSASRSLLEKLEPTSDFEEAQYRQQLTTEARQLLEENNTITIGGARDVRTSARSAERGLTLMAEQLLEIKSTLLAAATLKQSLGKVADRFPLLAGIAAGLDEGKPIVSAISRIIDDRGEVLDSASPRLAQIRHDQRVAQDRLQSKLQAILNSGQYAPFLQETLITQRGGRYVIPVKAEARGRVKGIVHDQSSSGATLFVEPLATVEINNQIRELELAEQDEILRLLREVSTLVGEHAGPIIETVEALAALDASFAMAKYAGALRANPPRLMPLHDDRFPGSTLRLYSARHPLIDPREVVPIDIEMDDDTFILIITGPNTGGKTVSLKTAGLLTLMAQCGLHIPASDRSELSVFQAVYADIGDEQSIEQSLSTFSAHLRHIIDILELADERSLVLLDELGSGTDPTEGAAIARAILDELRQRGVTTFVATHYPELKLYAHSTPGVRNASVEFDVETLSPTYRLIIGLPGRSNAIAIATRLGLPASIIEQARSYIGADDLHTDDLLDEIHRSREEIRQTQARLVRAEREVSTLHQQLTERLGSIEQERQAIIEEASSSAQAELDALREEIRDLRRRLRIVPPTFQAEAAASLEEVGQIEKDAATLGALIDAPASRPAVPPPAPQVRETGGAGELQVGNIVFVPRLKAEGEIVSMDSPDEVEVQVGQFRVRVDPASLEFRSRGAGRLRGGDEGAQYQSAYDSVRVSRPPSPGLELHLRGMTLEEALPLLDDYLDQAYMSGLPWVRIVHGKGTGVLRKGVRDTLKRSPLVKDYKSAPPDQGGDGVTIVHFVPLV